MKLFKLKTEHREILNYRFDNFAGYFGKRGGGGKREACLECLKTFLIYSLYYRIHFLNYVKTSVKAEA
jgi:hypothetical protein